MRKLFGVAVLAVTLAGCAVDISAILAGVQKNAKEYCGVVVNLTDLAAALSNQDPKALVASQIAHSICDQYKTQAPTATETGCRKVMVKDKPVEVCK